MQKFDTPAPITAVLDIPAGRIQFIAADRADTTVEVRPADAAKGRDVKAARAGHGRLRRRRPADRGPRREEPVLRTLRIHRGDGRTARRLAASRRRRPAPSSGASDGSATSPSRALGTDQDRRGRERPRRPPIVGDVTVGRLTGPAEISTQKGDINIAEATAGTVVLRTRIGQRDGRRRPRSLRLPGRRHPLRPDPQHAAQHRRRRRRPEHPRDHRPRRHRRPAASEERQP